MHAPLTQTQAEEVEHVGKADGVDMVAISRILLRILAHLEEVEYTESYIKRQIDVLAHDDPPDPASDKDTTRS
jgi:hypothetical protein